MGMVDGIEDLGKVVEGLVEGREDPSHAPEGLTGKLGKAIKGAAGSEILDAGQILIGGMRLTTGSGDPAQGQQFGQGSHRFNAAGDTVKSAFATDDWQGAGADAYGAANRDQAGRTASLAVLDRGVQTVIAREAYQVAYHRDKLDDASNYLGDLSSVTWSIALIPGVGKAMKAAVELAAVQSALSLCSFELSHLSQEAGENAEQLQKLAGDYSAFIQTKAAPPDLDDVPPPHTEDRTGSVPSDQVRLGEPAADDGEGPSVAPSPGGSSAAGGSVGAPLSGTSSATPGAAVGRLPEQSVAPAEANAAAAMPTEAMSGMTSAFGAVGGMIGSVVAPLAAVLTGVAGAAGQSLSTLMSGGGAGAGADTDATTLDEEVDRRLHGDGDGDPTRDDAAAGETGADGGTVPPAPGTDSAGAAPPAADKLEPERLPAPPAPTRPPQ